MDRAEPEAVDAATQARITLEAARSWPHLNALHSAERTSQPLATRIERIKAQARHLGVDVHPEMRLVKLAMQGGRSEAHIERRVAAVESKLWPNSRL